MNEYLLAGHVVVEADLPFASSVPVRCVVVVDPVLHIVRWIAVGRLVYAGLGPEDQTVVAGADIAYVDAGAAEINVA